MFTRRIVFLLFGIFFLAGAAAATTDMTHSTMTSSNTGWIVANGNDQVTITVHVTDGTSDLNGATVDFSLADDSKDLGTLSAQTMVTGMDGVAQSVFKTTTKSGTATIKARITYNDGSGVPVTITLSCTQKIDHNAAQYATADYPYSVPAGSVAHITVTFTDQYKNAVDNKNPGQDHLVNLSIQDRGETMFTGSGDPYIRDFSTDAYGNISFDVLVSTKAGSNVVSVYHMDNFAGMLVTISSAADSVPCYLVQMPPSPNTYPADGKDEHRFTLYYTVLDKYQNPLGEVELLVTSSLGEEARIITNDNGMNYTYYGPKDVAKTYTITAVPVITGTKTTRNATILCMNTGETGVCTQTVTYTTLDPKDMILTASPQTMVSWDVAGASKVNVNARVVDDYGNGVKDQTVTFTKSPDTATGFTETAQSSLSPLSGTTDANGYAVVKFQPGTFATKSQTGYNEAATGSCKVTAKWTNPKTGEVKSRDITFVWKNYPFLNVDSAIDKSDPQIGDTINVKVWIRGTGAALQPKPINVVLCIDRSGSMLEDTPDRMYSIREAAKSFVDQMSSKDSVALVTFGKSGDISLPGVDSYSNPRAKIDNTYIYPTSYSDYATVDKGLTSLNPSVNPNAVSDLKSALMGIVPDSGTPMREGLHKSIPLLPPSSSSSVNAIILLSDGDYNWYGDPLGPADGGTGYSPSWRIGPTSFGDVDNDYMIYNDVSNQNLALYAKSKGIKIYTIAYGNSLSSGGSTALSNLATSSGGKYYTASSANIASVYHQIAGELNEQAGGQTQLIADFSKITVDGNVVSGTGVDSYLAYNYNNAGLVESSSTFVSKTSTNVPVDTTKNDYYTKVRDDRDNWTSPKLPGLTAKKLQFDVGKIILNDVWETNIQFTLTGAGTIQIFGDNCPVTFIDMTDPNNPKSQTVTVPSKTWTTHQSKVNTPFGTAPALTVKVASIADGTTDPSLWTVTWKTTYDGASTVREKLMYCSETEGTAPSCKNPRSGWAVYPLSIPSMGKVTDREDTLIVDTSSWTPGEKYTLSIWAETDDGQTNWDDAAHTKEDGSKKAYIKLQ